MLRDVILGLLRDGRLRHGYELIVQYRSRTGCSPGPGNFYRELGQLRRTQLIELGPNPAGADPRRRPYLISKKGCLAFDRWLLAWNRRDRDLWERLLFVDRLPAPTRVRLVRLQQQRIIAQASDCRERAALQDRSAGSFSERDIGLLVRTRQLRQLEVDAALLREVLAAMESRSHPQPEVASA